METTKDYYFTDNQIDYLLTFMRDYLRNWQDETLCELADLIEDQIVNHPNNQ